MPSFYPNAGISHPPTASRQTWPTMQPQFQLAPPQPFQAPKFSVNSPEFRPQDPQQGPYFQPINSKPKNQIPELMGLTHVKASPNLKASSAHSTSAAGLKNTSVKEETGASSRVNIMKPVQFTLLYVLFLGYSLNGVSFFLLLFCY